MTNGVGVVTGVKMTYQLISSDGVVAASKWAVVKRNEIQPGWRKNSVISVRA